MEQENKLKITTKTTKIPLYCPDNRIRVCIVDRLKDVKSFRDTVEDADQYDVADAVLFIDESKKYTTFTMIFEREHIGAGHIAHESIHMKNHIFGSIGIELDPANDEPEAYFMQWLVDFATSVWKKDQERFQKDE